MDGVVSRQPRKSTGGSVNDYTLIVRPPGKPAEIRVFTDARRDEAEAYAVLKSAVVESLPFPYPD